MPVLNEAAYLEHAVASVLEQDVGQPLELVLALGPSTDGTTAIAQGLAERDPRVRIVHNPAAHIPVGLNAAIRASRYATIVRVDAHSELSVGYVARAIATLERTGAANVGGIMHANGRTPFQSAVARAYNSPAGLGGGAYHGGTDEGDAESAYLGVMRREVLDEVGFFDETIRRGEDWELNLRILQAGHRVWFDPTLAVTYWPRESWIRLARQFRATGAWRGELVRRYGRRNGLRFFAPPALTVAVAMALVVGVLQLSGVLQGVASVVASVIYLPLVAYVALVVTMALIPGKASDPPRTPRERLWTLAVLPTMHLSWGLGFLSGVLRGAGDTVDASRLGTRNTPLP